MSNILLLLQRVHQNVHQIRHSLDKKKFSEPKIYTGGVNLYGMSFPKNSKIMPYLKIGTSIINS